MRHTLSLLGGRTMKVYTAALAAALWLCLAATALPSDIITPSRGPQGLPGPGQASPPVASSPEFAPSDNAPPSRGPQGLPGPGPSPQPVAASPDVVSSPPDQGPSAFTLLLIAFGGALALTGVVFIAKRTVYHRHAVR